MCEYAVQMIDRKLQENPYITWKPLEAFVDPEQAALTSAHVHKPPFPPKQPPPQMPYPPAWRRPPPDPASPSSSELSGDTTDQVGLNNALPSKEQTDGDDEEEGEDDVDGEEDDEEEESEEEEEESEDDEEEESEEKEEESEDEKNDNEDEDDENNEDEESEQNDEKGEKEDSDGEDDKEKEGGGKDEEDQGDKDSQSKENKGDNNSEEEEEKEKKSKSVETQGSDKVDDTSFIQAAAKGGEDPTLGSAALAARSSSYDPDFNARRDMLASTTVGSGLLRLPPMTEAEAKTRHAALQYSRSVANEFQMGGREVPAGPLDVEATPVGSRSESRQLSGDQLKDIRKELKDGGSTTGLPWTKGGLAALAGRFSMLQEEGARMHDPARGEFYADARPAWATSFLQGSAESDALHAARVEAAVRGLSPADAALEADRRVREASLGASRARAAAAARGAAAAGRDAGSVEAELRSAAERFAERMGPSERAFASLLQAGGSGGGYGSLRGDIGSLPTPAFDRAAGELRRNAAAFAREHPDIVADGDDPVEVAAAQTAADMRGYRFKEDLPAGMDAEKLLTQAAASQAAQTAPAAQPAADLNPASTPRFRSVVDMGFGAPAAAAAAPQPAAAGYAAQFAQGAQAAFAGQQTGAWGQPGAAAPRFAAPMGGTMPGQAMPGQAMPGQAMPGQAMPGQAMPGQAMPGQAMPGQAMPAHAQAAQHFAPPSAYKVGARPAQASEAQRFRQTAAAAAGSSPHAAAAAEAPKDDAAAFRDALSGIAASAGGAGASDAAQAAAGDARFRGPLGMLGSLAGRVTNNAMRIKERAESAAGSALSSLRDFVPKELGKITKQALASIPEGVALTRNLDDVMGAMTKKADDAAKRSIDKAEAQAEEEQEAREEKAKVAEAAVERAKAGDEPAKPKPEDPFAKPVSPVKAPLRDRASWGLPHPAGSHSGPEGESDGTFYHGMGMTDDLKGDKGAQGGDSTSGWTALNTYPHDADDDKFVPGGGKHKASYDGLVGGAHYNAQKAFTGLKAAGMPLPKSPGDPAALDYGSAAEIPNREFRTGPREAYRALYRMRTHKRFYELYDHVMDALDDVCKGMVPREIAYIGCQTLYANPARMVDWLLHGYQPDEVCVKTAACDDKLFKRQG